MKRILAADIGGTSARLAIAQCTTERCEPLRVQTFPSGRYSSLTDILTDFLHPERERGFDGVCLAIAGPVQTRTTGQTAKVTNLPWVLDSAALAQTFGFSQLRLINDFEAIGYGLAEMQAADFSLLQPGEPDSTGPRGLIGAGTGLGQALLLPLGERQKVIPTEGGHADFGPVDAVQLELAQYLIERHGHASYEMILSGSGLVRLYHFMRNRNDVTESHILTQALEAGDGAAAITQAALERDDPLARRTLDLFVRIYGAQAGNLALAVGATGGVDIAGGIAPRIVSVMGANFISAFRNKGAMRDYVSRIPVRVITNTEVGLRGAMHYASRLPEIATHWQPSTRGP